MAYNVKLTFSTPSKVFFKGRAVFRLLCVASDAVNMPNEIFGHQKTAIDPLTETQKDDFSFVCGPYELSDFPVGAPDPGQIPAFFRKDTVDMLIPSTEEYDEVKAAIIAQVGELIEAQTRLDDLAVEDIVWIPAAP